MLSTGFDSRVKIQQIVENQLPEFITVENPKATEFLKQYYISQEFQGGPVDIIENLDQYLKLDSFTPDVIVENTQLFVGITSTDSTINVNNTKGYPQHYGLLKIDDEIITYVDTKQNKVNGTCKISVGSSIAYFQGLDTNLYIGRPFVLNSLNESPTIVSIASTFVVLSKVVVNNVNVVGYNTSETYKFSVESPQFVGCKRGFSGIVNYHSSENPEELEFSTSNASSHVSGSKVQNLSSLFLKEFYKKIKQTLAPGFEDIDFVPELDVNNFIKQVKDFYKAKGTTESIRILYNILYGVDPRILNLEDFLIKPSDAEFIRREVIVTELISGKNPNNLVGQVIKNSANTASAPVSEVEIIKRNNKNFYKIQLFAGFNDKSLIEGTFKITPQTKVVDSVQINDTIITVDSTIGFPQSGTLICGSNVITYKDRNINQFFDCEGIKSSIIPGSDIRLDDFIYGYENGDLSKKVQLRITGVLSELENQNDIYYRSVNDIISVKYIGEKIINPQNKTYKQFVFNSFIYNTSSRYEISSFNNSQIILHEIPDKSSLKIGDSVNILDRNSENIVVNDAIIISIVDNVIILNKNITGVSSNRRLSVRKNVNYAKSSNISLKYPKIISDIQNTYIEGNDYIHIASNSLPSFNISKNIILKSITVNSSNVNSIIYKSNPSDLKYSIISFDTSVPFITGDFVIYTGTGNPISGLSFGQTYYIEVLDPPFQNRIRLYNARSFIKTQNYIEFNGSDLSLNSQHNFTLESQSGNKKIAPKKILRKIPLEQNIQSGVGTLTKPGPIGMLINGVEIINYKSDDKIYYGPLDRVRILNSGTDYDVINPSNIKISNPAINSGINALANICVKGNLKEVFVDPNDVDIEKIISISLEGGNGSGAILEPILERRFRELSFNAQLSSNGGGIDVSNDTISFIGLHDLEDGAALVYNSNGNNPIGIGSFTGSNTDQNKFLVNGSVYYSKNVNTTSIKLYNTLSDYNLGINTVGFTTINTGGIHRFRLLQDKNILSGVKVINSGEGYENRVLRIKSSGISTVFNTINFKNHGFNDGDLIHYSNEIGFGSTQSTPISGISTLNQYYIIKINNDSFKLSDAGNINSSPTKINYERKKYAKFLSSGSGVHIFKYPPIKIDLKVEYSGSIEPIVVTPVVRGSIVDAYLYEPGTDYGSDILNFHKKPVITIENGLFAQLKPIVSNGSIVNVEVQNRGRNYTFSPDLVVNGDGIGAKLRAVVENGKIVRVVVINGGKNYDPKNTSIKIQPTGRNGLIDVDVRSLTVNNQKRFSDEILTENVLNKDELHYGIVGYSTEREGLYFSDPDFNTGHSKVIGWAYDGNPIYGPFGYSDPNDNNSQIVKLNTGYTLSNTNVYNRPDNFELGFFVEDYKYTSTGDLDIYNGRFSKTPEFPNGIYAYYVGLRTDSTANKLVADFPYFIGNQYRSNVITDLNSNQEFDFNNSKLVRNTFPYRIEQTYSNNDFIIEPNKKFKQVSAVESISKGSVEDIVVISTGDEYSVGDLVLFDNENTDDGGGASAVVESIKGKSITNIETTSQIYENVVFVKKNQNQLEFKTSSQHNLLNGEIVQISGISTNVVKNLNNTHTIGVSSEYSSLVYEVPANSNSGIVTDIYILPFPSNVSVGSTIGIGTERLSVINIFKEQNILRVLRGVSGVAHTSSSRVNFYSDRFTINLTTDGINSQFNEKVYFNPKTSLGVGTVPGNSTNINYFLGKELKNISVETQSIYLPNHNFKTNQKVLLHRPTGNEVLTVRNSPSSNNFNLPNFGNNTYVYIINKSKDFIGIVTEVGLTTTTKGLYFTSNGTDSNLYYFETLFDQEKANVKKIQSKVSVSTVHNLKAGDTIDLVIKPKLFTGVNLSNSIVVKYNSLHDKLLVNLIGFSSTMVDVENNSIQLANHGLKTGQKVFYNSDDSVASGLSTGGYFIYRIDDNNINLCETFVDSTSFPPSVVSIGDSGGSTQELSLINPQLKITRNNSIVFDLSDSSLVNHNFKLFFDKDQKNEFISIGNTSNFTVIQTGTIGISPSAKLTIGFNTSIPTNLYYALEKDGNFVSTDNDVLHPSNIVYGNSIYNGKYKVFGVGSTSFNITLNDIPEKYSYTKEECDELSYSTNSLSATGGINNINLISGGFNYSKAPRIIGFSTASKGFNAILKTKSTNIGKIKQLRILNEGFEYSSDKTLKPKADIPKLLKIQSSEKITSVNVLFGGRNFLSNPKLVLINDFTRKKISSGLLEPIFEGSSIYEVNVVEEPKGLESVSHTIFTENNSNGIRVDRIESYTDGIVTCRLVTPAISGFIVPPFAKGDFVFVEGLQKRSTTDVLGNVSSPGTGFNSVDNGYRFFEVVDYINSNPAILKYNIGKYTNNAGVPLSRETTFNSIVNQKNYPTFKINKVYSFFNIGEKLIVNGVLTDLVVETSDTQYVTVMGEYSVKFNDVIKGSNSGNVAIVDENVVFSGEFNVNYSNQKEYGWKNDTGKLNDSYQVLPDNDYYQTLSYSVKTSGENYKNNKVLEFDTVSQSINSLVHPAGLKNFVDVGITSSAKLGIGSDQQLNNILDFVSERRVDTFNNFDFGIDYNPSLSSSDAIIFKNRKLADYIECVSNRVLQIDDISNRFSSQEFNRDDFVEIIEYSITDQYSKFLVQVMDEDKQSIQASEVVILNNFENTYTLNKSDLYTKGKFLGNLSGGFAPNGNPVLKFNPVNPFDVNYNIKIYRDYFSPFSYDGVGFTDLGFIRLNGQNQILAANDGTQSVGITTDVFKSQFSFINSVYANVFIINNATLDMNYFEVLAYHDGKDGYISEYYFDTENNISGSSFGFIGTFGVSVDSGIFKLNFTNNTNNSVTVRAKTVGFGSTSAGISTYRFLIADQEPGTEFSARLESSHQVSVGNTTIISYDLGTEATLKSLVRVGVGTTVALHQILVVSDLDQVNMVQYPFLAVGTASTSGIGTFSANIEGTKVIVRFYPDQKYSSNRISIQKFNQFLYLNIDEFNIPPPLRYGNTAEVLENSFYGSLNEFGKDRLSFDLNHDGIPIFEKVFNPKNETILDKSTGIFTIKNHFFQTGEELIYTPDSTLSEITPAPIGIGSTLVGGTLFTGDLIVGISTITGVLSSDGISVGSLIVGNSISSGTTITSIGSTYTYFVGNVVSGGSSIISGIANTSILKVGSGLYSKNNVSLGTIVSIGINSITSSSSVPSGVDQVYYSTNLNIGITLSNVSTATTIRSNYKTGIITDLCPSTVYPIIIDNDRFRLSGTKNDASGVGFTFTSPGSGNIHKFEMRKKNEKSLITVNGVNQYPLIRTSVFHSLQYNNGVVGAAITFLSLSGISSIAPRDIIKVDNEYMNVINVGFGTTHTGPVTGLGTIPIVEITRGFVGSSATTHLDGTEVRIYRGAYNIVGNKIHFTEAPDGKGNNNRLDQSGLPLPKSTFNGRVFLRRNYEFNKIYDDISNQFTGIGRTFTLKENGKDTFGVEPGSGLVFINDVFQTPDTENNAGNNYKLTSSSGITTITFTGITRPNSIEIITVPYDINQNQVPRGGVVISLGSTGGIGYAPLVGAAVTAIIGAGGSITAIGIGSLDIIGSGYRYPVSVAITDGTGSGALVNTIVGAGGTLSFKILNGGSGYTNPVIKIDDPSYENLSVIGLTRLSVGNTSETGIGISITVDIEPATPTPISGRNADAARLIRRNRGLIAEVAVGRMLDFYPGFSVPGGNQKCISDITLVLESLSHNLEYGGNDRIYDAAKLYIDNQYLAGEEQQSIYAFQQARDLAIQAMRNQPISIGGYSTLDQYFDSTIEGDISGTPGVYNTNDCADVASSITQFVGIVTTAIGSSVLVASKTPSLASLFQVKSFNVTKPGYSFQRGDKFKVVGLVTDARLSNPIEELVFTVDEIATDTFASWQLGELDYIDSIKSLQDGFRTRFPLFRNNELLSFQKNRANPESNLIDFNTVLLIYLNGVMQEPGVSYIFEGGTTFSFREAPKPEDNIAIFFYRGTRDVDSFLIRVNETVKAGDNLQIDKNQQILNTFSQDERTVSFIESADLVTTGIYLGDGIDSQNFKPMNWTKQKRDLIINGNIESKSRDSLESLVFPTCKIIKNVSPSDSEIFVDDAQLFNYEENESNIEIRSVQGLLIQSMDPIPASFSVSVSTSSTISSVNILNGGNGYEPNSILQLKFAKPVGLGSTATATANVSAAGTISSVNIINPGFGYTDKNIPKVICETPEFKYELVSNIQFVEGFSGIITGITTSVGVNGNPLSLTFNISYSSDLNVNLDSLVVGYPIVVSETNIGNGVVSINQNDSDVIGIGTEFLDNIYIVNGVYRNNLVGIITCNVLSTSNISGISTFGTFCGRFSWGRLSGMSRSAKSISLNVNGYTVNSGLTTFPEISRRNYGLRDTGAILKVLPFTAS